MTYIIPAIDLLDGKVVRLDQGKYDHPTTYDVDVAEVVEEFVDAGADMVHVVDLNAARTADREINEEIRSEIVMASAGRLRLELGGGIRNIDAAWRALDEGFDRFVVGTAAVEERSFVQELVEKTGSHKFVVGLDAKDGRVRIRGWESDSGMLTEELLPRLEEDGVDEIIYTNIAHDGMLTGPPVNEIKALLKKTKMRIVASGGIGSIDDVRSLLEIRHQRLQGIITGKALYEGKLNLRDAVALSREIRTDVRDH